MRTRARGIAVIDLFAGAGGLSVGAHLAGGRVAASVDIDAMACETLRANAKYHGNVSDADVCTLSGKDLRQLAGISAKEPLVIVGGPPCQPFSKAAYWTEAGDDAAYRRARAKGIKRAKPTAPTAVKADERRDLVKEFMRLVVESNADGFLFENVPSIKHPRNLPLFQWVMKTADDAGYTLAHDVVNAAEYGVAQLRQRG